MLERSGTVNTFNFYSISKSLQFSFALLPINYLWFTDALDVEFLIWPNRLNRCKHPRESESAWHWKTIKICRWHALFTRNRQCCKGQSSRITFCAHFWVGPSLVCCGVICCGVSVCVDAGGGGLLRRRNPPHPRRAAVFFLAPLTQTAAFPAQRYRCEMAHRRQT